MLTVGLLGPCLHAWLEAVRGGHHGSAACKQAVDHLGGDGVRSHAGHHCDISSKTAVFCRFGNVFSCFGSDTIECDLQIRVVALACIPSGFVGNGLAETDEAAVQCGFIVVVVGACQVFTCGCPTIVEQNGLALVETRFDLLRPVSAEFSFDRSHNSRVLISSFLGNRSDYAQLVQHELRRGGEHAIGTGHLGCERVQSGGINHCPAGCATGARHGNGDALIGSNLLHGRIDQRVGSGRIGSGIRAQRGKITTTRAGPLTSLEHERSHHMGSPPFAKLPCIGHTLSDLAELHTGGTEHATHTVAHNVGQHRTERLVVRSDLVDQSAQRLDRRFGSTIHGSHTQFGTDVHKQLITARRHTIGQRIGGIAFADLIGANLSRVSQQCGNRIGCPECNIRNGNVRRSAGGSCNNRNFRNSSRSSRRS